MGSVAVAIAFGADELHGEPVIVFCGWCGAAIVVKELGVFAIIADEKILPAVVVVVADRETATHARSAKIRALRFGCVDEISLASVAVELFFFFVGNFGMIRGDVVEDVAVDDDQVAPAVVIEIKKPRAEGTVEKIRLARSEE